MVMGRYQKIRKGNVIYMRIKMLMQVNSRMTDHSVSFLISNLLHLKTHHVDA
jgi:hypothetical protein